MESPSRPVCITRTDRTCYSARPPIALTSLHWRGLHKYGGEEHDPYRLGARLLLACKTCPGLLTLALIGRRETRRPRRNGPKKARGPSSPRTKPVPQSRRQLRLRTSTHRRRDRTGCSRPSPKRGWRAVSMSSSPSMTWHHERNRSPGMVRSPSHPCGPGDQRRLLHFAKCGRGCSIHLQLT